MRRKEERKLGRDHSRVLHGIRSVYGLPLSLRSQAIQGVIQLGLFHAAVVSAVVTRVREL